MDWQPVQKPAEMAESRLLEAILEAKAVLWGSPCYFSRPNAFISTAMERLYPLRHRDLLTAGKPTAALVTGGGVGLDETAKLMQFMLSGYMGFAWQGQVTWASQTAPCFKCGFGGALKRSQQAVDRVYMPLLYNLYLWRMAGRE